MSYDLEFYETPDPFTVWLFKTFPQIRGRILEPFVGSGAIPRAVKKLRPKLEWLTNDIDARWKADYHLDAARLELYDRVGVVDWTVSNPAYSLWEDALIHAWRISKFGVALHVRVSAHEPLKSGIRQSLLTDINPAHVLWLPRFAYRRSRTTNKWSHDSVASCWTVWTKRPIERRTLIYAPTALTDAIGEPFLTSYRNRMDELTGYAEDVRAALATACEDDDARRQAENDAAEALLAPVADADAELDRVLPPPTNDEHPTQEPNDDDERVHTDDAADIPGM